MTNYEHMKLHARIKKGGCLMPKQLTLGSLFDGIG